MFQRHPDVGLRLAHAAEPFDGQVPLPALLESTEKSAEAWPSPVTATEKLVSQKRYKL